jgi:hypothetical protein
MRVCWLGLGDGGEGKGRSDCEGREKGDEAHGQVPPIASRAISAGVKG